MTRILIADDKPENLYLLRALLTGQGCEVEEARHGAEALVKARQAPPHLIISDLLMPVMDGYTLLRHWKGDVRLKGIPFIVYTATYTEPQDEKLALDLGADAFILKPAEPEPFMARVREVLAKDRAGQLTPAPPPVGEEKVLLKEYSETLIRKLEEKARQLEQANRELAAREARLRAIIENEPECVKLLAADGSLLEMNPAGLRMLEADSLPQIASHCVYPLVAEEHRPAFRALTQRVFAGESGVLEFEIVGLKGTRRWLETHASPLRDACGNITALLGITRDITARKAAENALRGREASYATLVKNISGAVYRCRNDADWTVAFISDGCLDITGYRADELTGNRVTSLGALQHSDDAAAVWEKCQANLAAHRACSNEYRIIHRNGEVRWVWDQAQGIYSASGELLSIEGLLTDITAHKRAEAAVRESEARFRAIFAQAAVGVAQVAPDGRWLDVNQRLCEIVGYAREELLGGTFQAITHPDDLEADLEFVRQMLANEIRSYAMEKRYRRKDGSLVWIHLTVSLVRGPLAVPLYFISVVQDISARKRAEEKYRSIFEHAVEGIFQSTPEGRYLTVNPAMARIYGYAAPEEMMREVTDIGRQIYADVEERRQALAKLDGCEGVVSFECRVLRRDGTIFWIRQTSRSVRDAEGRLVCYEGSLEDITERKQAEAALRDAEARLRLSVAASNIGLWDWNLATNDVYFSREWKGQLGYAEDEIPNHFEEWERRLHPDDLAETLARVRAFIQNPAAEHTAEFRLRHKDGSWRWVFTQAQIFRDAAGQPARMMGCHIDITRRKQAELNLKSVSRRLLDVQEEERRHLARELHDQIGQALTAVQLDLKSASRLADKAEVVQQLAGSMKLLEQIQAQVQTLSLNLRPSMLDDLGLASALRGYLREQAERAGLRAHFHPALSKPRLHPAVETACFRVAQEAITNVLRHAHARTLTVSLRDEADGLHLIVADDGAGFDPAHLPQSEAPGAGLGLLGMEERVALLGGWIKIDSKPGAGTTVHACFPLPPPVALPSAR